MKQTTLALTIALALAGCSEAPEQNISSQPEKPTSTTTVEPQVDDLNALLAAQIAEYAEVELTTDMSVLTASEKAVVKKLIEAAKIMDDLFWKQAYGDKEALLSTIDMPNMKRLAEINYGPWNRLAGNSPFVPGVSEKPKGANYYPADMTAEEFAALADERKSDLYTLVRRDDAGNLVVVPYHVAFEAELSSAAALLKEAATLSEDLEFANYLTMRADALLSGDYQPSDMAWMEMKDNRIEVVYGPIETYEDQMFGNKAAFEAFVLIKDMAWSERLKKYAQYMPDLQRGLPVDDAYKSEVPGSNAQLNAYDAIYYAGDSNAGSKTIAINLPNDEQVQLEKGTRRLQLKNVMKAKFDKIMLPIASELIAEDQRQFVTFDAFFANTMFHEVAHGLGIKNTIDGNGTVRSALKEHASALEEGKADVLGIYMIDALREKGVAESDMRENYTTFLAGIFRSVRFGSSSAHGRANMIRFNYFQDAGAFSYDESTGTYRVDFEMMAKAVDSLSAHLLKLQGDGDYEGAAAMVATQGAISEALQKDLNRLTTAGIPTDIVFKQGMQLLH